MTQTKHPPLYHILAAAVAAPLAPMERAFLRSNPDVSVLPDVPGTAPNFFVHTRLEDWPWQGGVLAMWLDGWQGAGGAGLQHAAAPDRDAGPRRVRALVAPALTLGIALLVAAPWLWRNWQLYGDPTGTALALATVDRRQAPLVLADLVWLLRGWVFSFWGKFGGAGHIPLPWPFYLLWALLVGAAVAGWLRWLLFSRREGRGLACATRPAAHVVLWGTPALVALYILSYSRLALGTDQGRLLFPAIAPLALLLAGGLSAWLPDERPALLPAGVAGLMGAVALLALYAGIIVPFAPPAAPPANDVAGAVPVAQQVGDDLEVVGLHWLAGEDAQPPTGLVIYWRAHAAPPADLRAVLRLFAKDGTLLWEAKRSPGAGRFSTDRWPAGWLLADEYALPSPAAAQMAHAELAVQPFPQGSYLPQTQPARPGAWVSLPVPEGSRD